MDNLQAAVENQTKLIQVLQSSLGEPNWSSWLTFGTVCVATFIAFKAYRVAKAQLIAMKDNQKMWETIAACEKFDLDPTLHELKMKTWNYVYNVSDSQTPEHKDAVPILNYFESLAIGIDKDAYREDIVKEHHYAIMEIFWKRLSRLTHIDKSNYPGINDLLSKWYANKDL